MAARAIAVGACALLWSGCRTPDAPVAPIDLLSTIRQADRRAARPLEEAIRIETVTLDGDARLALLTTAPARVTWSLRFPVHARLRTAVALVPDAAGAMGEGVTARIGVGDARLYEMLSATRIAPADTGWRDVDVDLSAYAGWQWSLFYRPSARQWGLVFSSDAGPSGTVAWARPTITAGASPERP